MDGLIHDEADLKVLILFVLNRLPAPIDPDWLYEICLCDNGFDYFDFTQSLYDLVSKESISETEDGLKITSKGAKNSAALEKTLPASVRNAALRNIKPAADMLSRYSNIKAEILLENGECNIHLGLSDGKGSIFDARFLCSGEEQAKLIKKNFRRNAEQYYMNFIEQLSEGSGRK